MSRKVAREAQRTEERRVMGTLRGLKLEPPTPKEFPMARAPFRARLAFAWALMFLPLYLLTLALVWAVDRVQGVANLIDGVEGRDYWGRQK